MNKAIFMDRDGTINKDTGYLYEVQKFEFLPGVIEALKIFQKMNYWLYIITNQSGIARGYYTENDYSIITQYMLDCLREYGIEIKEVLYCPHHPHATVERYKKKCNCRKPKTGLFEKIQEKWDIDFSKSYAIGDKISDCEICLYTECRGYVLGIDEWTLEFQVLKERSCLRVDQAIDLSDTAKKIKRNYDGWK